MRKNINVMTDRSTPQTNDRSTTMNIRPLIAALAFVSIAAPLAAHADAPSGDINTVFAIDQTTQASVPDFDRREHRTYVEDVLAGPTSTTSSQVTREQVREELARMPPERVGA
jgi:hypothetical protein